MVMLNASQIESEDQIQAEPVQPEEQRADAALAGVQPEGHVWQEVSGQIPSGITVRVESAETSPPPAVDEAQAAYDSRKQSLESEIARLAIEQVRLKGELKRNRTDLAEMTEDLESHIACGPRRLPLFDRPPEDAATSEPAALDEPGSADEDRPPEAADAMRVNLLSEVEAEGLIFGQPGPATAYTDDDGDVFLAMKDAEGQWHSAYLDDAEWEDVEGPAAAAESPAQESWRATKIADIHGMTPKIVEILDGHDIRTLGDWVDLPCKRGIEYTQLKGITEARFEKIQEAMLRLTTGGR